MAAAQPAEAANLRRPSASWRSTEQRVYEARLLQGESALAALQAGRV